MKRFANFPLHLGIDLATGQPVTQPILERARMATQSKGFAASR